MKTVPPILHQAWIGDPTDAPEWVGLRARVVRELCADAGIEYVFWDDDRIAEHAATQNIVALYDKYNLKDIRVVKDILRMWIIREQGGIWMDNDIHPLVPLDEFVHRSGWVCANFEEVSSVKVTQQALFALPPASPMMDFILTHALGQLRAGVRNAHFIAGPRSFRMAEDAHPGEIQHYNRMDMRDTAAMRKAAQAGEIDVRALRERSPEAWFMHIDGDMKVGI